MEVALVSKVATEEEIDSVLLPELRSFEARGATPISYGVRVGLVLLSREVNGCAGRSQACPGSQALPGPKWNMDGALLEIRKRRRIVNLVQA